MFTLDWSDPQTFWLNVTNVVLMAVTVACLVIVVAAAVRELLARARSKMPILARESPEHSVHVPELGLTMADGGEPMPRTTDPKPYRPRS